MTLRRLLPMALALLAGTGMAQAGIFFGASYGQTSFSQDESGFSLDDQANAFKAFGGFTFMKFVGVEASYVDFGDIQDEVSPGTDVKVDATGWDIFAKGILPIGKHFDLFAKAGVVVWDTEATLSGAISGSDKKDGSDPVYGAGMTFRFLKVVGIRAEYERFDIGDTDAVDLVSAGVELKF